jgi:hypothetical protein
MYFLDLETNLKTDLSPRQNSHRGSFLYSAVERIRRLSVREDDRFLIWRCYTYVNHGTLASGVVSTQVAQLRVVLKDQDSGPIANLG